MASIQAAPYYICQHWSWLRSATKDGASCRVRSAINTHTDFGHALEGLTAFFARLQANPPSGKPPAGKPERQTTSGAQQSSAAAGPSTRSGRQQGSGSGAGVQSGKPRIPDTAGRHFKLSCAANLGQGYFKYQARLKADVTALQQPKENRLPMH